MAANKGNGKPAKKAAKPQAQSSKDSKAKGKLALLKDALLGKSGKPAQKKLKAEPAKAKGAPAKAAPAKAAPMKAAKSAKVEKPKKEAKTSPKLVAKVSKKAAAEKPAEKPAKSAVQSAPVGKGKAAATPVKEVPSAVAKPAKAAKGAKAAKTAGDGAAKVVLELGETVCREVACEGLATSMGYCRLHYIKNWKKIKRKEVILKEKKLNQYIEELVAKYPDKYIEAIRQDLANDKDFAKVIYDLDLDESVDDFDVEGESEDNLIDNIKREIEDEGETF